MALIKCPECGKEISEKAVHCIHCGFPLNQHSEINVFTENDTQEPEVKSFSPEFKVQLDELDAEQIENISSITQKIAAETSKLNEKIDYDYFEDEDFGLVKNKPILLSFDKKSWFTENLKKPNGEMLSAYRNGSVVVEGFNGPIDEYSLKDVNGNDYQTIYVSFYFFGREIIVPKCLLPIKDYKILSDKNINKSEQQELENDKKKIEKSILKNFEPSKNAYFDVATYPVKSKYNWANVQKKLTFHDLYYFFLFLHFIGNIIGFIEVVIAETNNSVADEYKALFGILLFIVCLFNLGMLIDLGKFKRNGRIWLIGYRITLFLVYTIFLIFCFSYNIKDYISPAIGGLVAEVTSGTCILIYYYKRRSLFYTSKDIVLSEYEEFKEQNPFGIEEVSIPNKPREKRRKSLGLLIATIVLSITTVGLGITNYLSFSAKEEAEEIISYDKVKYDSLEHKYNVLSDDYDRLSEQEAYQYKVLCQIGFVGSDDEKYYHKWNCEHFHGDTYWAFNVEYAKGLGYERCPYCW